MKIFFRQKYQYGYLKESSRRAQHIFYIRHVIELYQPFVNNVPYSGTLTLKIEYNVEVYMFMFFVII